MIHRGLLVATAACALLTPSGYAAAATGPDHSVAIARLLLATPVREAPRTSSPLLATVSAVRPLTGQQTALPVIAEHLDTRKTLWLRVRLPGRPNGRTGWIRAASARLVASPWRLVVIRARREVRLLREDRLVERLRVVVGAPATPTPHGAFFVVEHVRQADGSPLGRWALATSAHSSVLQEFDGGPGQVALHGRRGPLAIAPLGTAASHGCVRLDNATLDRIAQLVPNGTPVEIL